MPHVGAKYNISRLVGDVYVPIHFECAQWKMQARETYRDAFQARTKTPILFVSNSYDQMTPLASVKIMTSGFEGSVLLEQVAYGASTPLFRSVLFSPFVFVVVIVRHFASSAVCRSWLPFSTSKFGR